MRQAVESSSRLVNVTGACAMTSLSRTMISRLRSEGRFPAAVSLGEKRISFVRAEIDQWIDDRIAARPTTGIVSGQRVAV